MANAWQKLARGWRYGAPIVVVSGLPRSGTSMLMSMLEAGGLTVLTDSVRSADSDNPKGYFEHERVKDLEDEPDKSWLREARGKVIKVISHLLEHLPEENFYQVVLVRRDLDEVVRSQNKMLVNRGEENPIEDERAKELYRQHLIQAKARARALRNFELLEVQYTAALAEPAEFAAELNAFLGRRLDERAMCGVVDPNLYRNRS